MAEVLATMVIGPLVSMVKEKASSYLLDQYGVMDGMEDQHKLLKRKLPAVLDVITDAEEQAAKNREGAKAWLEELRNVAYKANDVLDEFKYEALRRKAKKEGHYKELGIDIIKLFPSHNRFVFHYRMANKLRTILQEIDVLITEMNTFRFEFKPQPPTSLKWRHTDPNIPDHYVKIASESRSKEKAEIVHALLRQEGNVRLTVLPIVGMGGMGKTTLAQLVYNDMDIQRHFQVRLWVCVSQNFDVYSLAERIVEEAKLNGCGANGNTALDKLQNAVNGKRYLLVLDDVWNREAYKWEKLEPYLHGGTGSSVVITTRDENVAQIMRTMKDHKIKGLDLNFMEEIIRIGAFSSQAEVPAEFNNLVGDIANKCKGSPLAATALGYVLRSKSTMQEWEAVINRSTICDEENAILPILKLSYNCLPPHMRQCFAFCAMFPKDHEIDVEMLIRLWMANCFIPEKKGVCPEVTGQQIFNELAQRSFFQEVKQARPDKEMYWDEHWYCSRITCKIHDLMHDVAQDAMGKECAVVDTELSQSEDFPYTARHLFLSVDIPENVMNASIQKRSPAIQTLIYHELEKRPPATQTLIYHESKIAYMKHLSKYRAMRALKVQQGSFLESKYLHHLRYLDLSRSNIKALPKDITILYHLQTLDLSYCGRLEQLPMAMMYMTNLHHLYTHGCDMLKSMPPNLGYLTFLQTLTRFVACTGSGCSNVGELEKLDLGGELELIQLENVSGADAKAASLGKKKRLEELSLRWTGYHDKEADQEVLEGLKPHDGLKALRMYSYGGSAIPTWMLGLQDMVELKLKDCLNLENLPALWQLPSLQFLHLRNLQNLHCLFSGAAPAKFQKLKRMELRDMPRFETWWNTNEAQGEEPIFPEVEYLKIEDCGSLTSLPKASVIEQSAFPALREMILYFVDKFHRWEAAEGSLGDQVAFPQLEKLDIWGCLGLTTFPKAPKLRIVNLKSCSQQVSLEAASRYIASLSSLRLEVSTDSNCNKEENSIEVLVHDHEFPLRDLELSKENSIEVVACDHEAHSPLRDLVLDGFELFFSHPSALALWRCFGQLSELEIVRCAALVYWPEKLFQGLVSLRTLKIGSCSNLTGHMKEKASDEQSAVEQSGVHLAHLESLEISYCESLVHVPNLSSSPLKTLRIWSCDSLESVVFSSEQAQPVSGESGVVQAQPAETSSSSSYSLIAAGPSSASSNRRRFFPCLESLEIYGCGDLFEVSNLPRSIKTLKIGSNCGRLVFLPGQVPSLEELHIAFWESLQPLLNGPPQVYSTLRVLDIEYCGIKQFPPQRLLQEQVELDSKPESISDRASTTVVLKQSQSTNSNHSLFPCLESLRISTCKGLTEVANLPPSIKTLKIWYCRNLVSLSGEVPSLEELNITTCERLISLPDGPDHQVYSSLRVLRIEDCPGIKQFPRSLQQRLDHLDEKRLDRHLQGPILACAEPRMTPWPYATLLSISRLVCLCFAWSSED